MVVTASLKYKHKYWFSSPSEVETCTFMNLKNDVTSRQQTAAIKTKHSFIPFLKFLTVWLQACYMSVQNTCHKKMKYMYMYMYELMSLQ